MTAPTDPRTPEREALEAALGAAQKVVRLSDGCEGNCDARPDECMTKRLFAAILAYGRAVREADKEAARNGYPNAMVFAQEHDRQLYAAGWEDAADAIEALEKKPWPWPPRKGSRRR